MRHLILGGGPAGIAAAKAIRKAEKGADVVICSEEMDAPYLRPLLPDLVAGDTTLSAIADPQGKDLADLRITLRQGKRAGKVDAAGKRVTFSDGATDGYDALLIATGGKPVVPPALRKNLASILPFDSLQDSLRIRERASGDGVCVVYGPGFLGIVACIMLRRLGKEVVWLRPDLPRYGYPIAGELEASILDEVRNKGVRIEDGADIAEVRDVDGKISAVSTIGGGQVRCSLIVVATERQPSVDFLEGSGVKVGTGVLVDDYLRTSVPDVYAAGDCAEVYDKTSKETKINFGWRSAIKQGQLAGENMAGKGKLYIRKPEDYFWLLFGSSLLDRIR